MLSFKQQTPDDVARQLAARFRDRRLEHGWSRAELSARSGVAGPTLRLFEDTGKISLDRLLKLASALGRLGEFEQLVAGTAPVRTLAELEALESVPKRQRGRTLATHI